MDERKLTEDQLEETSGGGLSETLNYALEQGKKVAAVLSDTLGYRTSWLRKRSTRSPSASSFRSRT